MVDIVSRVKNILLTPKEEWSVIAAEPTDLKSLFTGYVMILAAIPAVAGLIGNAVFGGHVAYALVMAILSYVFALVSVFVVAKVIPMIAPKFGGTAEELPALKLAAYAPTAGWVAGILTILPFLGFVAVILGLYSIYLYYLGAMQVVRVPQDKAIVFTIVLFVIVAVIIIALSFVGGLIATPLLFR